MSQGRILESFEGFERALYSGCGIGIGSHGCYQSLFRVQDVYSCDRVSVILGIKSEREHHCPSVIESNFFYHALESAALYEVGGRA